MSGISQVVYRLVFVALAATVLSACRGGSDETRIRQALAETAQAVAAVDASAAVAHLTDDFDGNAGEWVAKDIANLLRLAKLRGETVHVLAGPVELEQRGDRYLARFTVTLTGGGQLLPSRIGIYRVETAWRREGKTWRCFSAKWTRVGDD